MAHSSAKFPCPCCGYKTLPEAPPGTYNLCRVCFWEDDQVQFNDPDYQGGANRPSLRQAQRNFAKVGACEEISIKQVRASLPEEVRDINWKPLSQP